MAEKFREVRGRLTELHLETAIGAKIHAERGEGEGDFYVWLWDRTCSYIFDRESCEDAIEFFTRLRDALGDGE